jgi:hypothetical protein
MTPDGAEPMRVTLESAPAVVEASHSGIRNVSTVTTSARMKCTPNPDWPRWEWRG